MMYSDVTSMTRDDAVLKLAEILGFENVQKVGDEFFSVSVDYNGKNVYTKVPDITDYGAIYLAENGLSYRQRELYVHVIQRLLFDNYTDAVFYPVFAAVHADPLTRVKALAFATSNA